LTLCPTNPQQKSLKKKIERDAWTEKREKVKDFKKTGT
jgi:hypothetical protein